jgi:transcriptional regulator with XRE-family HTH domain
MSLAEIDRLFGLAVREKRKHRGITQQQLAAKAGLNRVHVAKIEAGRSSPTLGVIDAIARAFDVPLDVLMNDVDGMRRARWLIAHGSSTDDFDRTYPAPQDRAWLWECHPDNLPDDIPNLLKAKGKEWLAQYVAIKKKRARGGLT